jgi:release factor glutamine methyltransferase
MTVAACLQGALQVLTSAGFSPSDAARDASALGRALLGWDQARWLTHLDAPAPEGFDHALLGAATRRARREPVAYIIGEREFFGRSFAVTSDVLVPRPETELLIDAAEQHAGALATRPGGLDVLDVGTGSGCLAVTLACEWPSARIAATDTSPAALQVAARNASRYHVSHRISWLNVSLTGGRSADVDLLVSNPPYVADADRPSLPADVVGYEPHAALFGGEDGLDVIRALVPAASTALRPGGWLIVEIGVGQALRVKALLTEAGLLWVETREDLAGIPRVIVARRPGLL